MKQGRRTFLTKTALTAGGFLTAGTGLSRPLEPLLGDIGTYRHDDLRKSVTDEDFWHLVRQAYTVSPAVINLNNGGVSPQPRVVQEAVERYNRLSNEAPSYYMWRILDLGREPLRARLAALAGCSADEIAIHRNATEAIETATFGMRLERGDEVVLTRQDYPNMIQAWKQREQRDGIVLRWLNFDFPSDDAQAMTQKFVDAFTTRTRFVHITHMINWNGQVLPARDIALAARERGIAVLVDGAHTFAHLEFEIPDLACDYFGTSLHKWLCAPFGSGMFYVRRENIASLWPLYGAEKPESDDIRKFEHLGTRSFAIEQAIGQALDFHEMIGSDRKRRRLHYLKNYWAEQAAAMDRVTIGTSLKPEWGCALGLLQIDGIEPGVLSEKLFSDYKIHTTPIQWENISGVRITPNVYTLRSELDKLLEAIATIVRT